MTWSAVKEREKYARRRAEGRCVRCGGLMLPEWGTACLCPGCADRRREYDSRPEVQAKERERSRLRAAALYAQDPEAFRRERRNRYEAKKLAGICIRCPSPCAEDSIYCAPHRETENAKNREAQRRRRAAEARTA